MDDNQGDLIQVARSIGAAVQPLSMVGGGCPDVLVAFRGLWYVAEIKDGNKPPSRRKLTKREREWHDVFGAVAPVHIWETREDVFRTLGVVDEMG